MPGKPKSTAVNTGRRDTKKVVRVLLVGADPNLGPVIETCAPSGETIQLVHARSLTEARAKLTEKSVD
ncbi:MAG: hypothetical protein R3C45_13870, partial [Phycisphaerales bacterium]